MIRQAILVALLFTTPALAEVPRQADAPAQLEYASKQKHLLRGRTGEPRRRARQDAIEAYRAVRHYFPRDRTVGAEASFRAGELFRSAGEQQEALAEFARAESSGGRTVFRARAGLEIAHLHRRGLRLMEALAAYERVMGRQGADRAYRDEATHWAGRVHQELGRTADARRLWERVAREGADPLDRIRAFDAWALSLLEEQDLEGAAGVLELCRSALRDVSLEETRLGTKVRASLERMRSVDRLVRAIQARQRRRSESGGGSRFPPARVAMPGSLLPGGSMPRRVVPGATLCP